MTRKTKAQLEQELADLRKRLEELGDDENKKPVAWIENWGPALVAVVGVVAVLGWQNIKVDPTPKPDPNRPALEKTVESIMPEIRKGYGETFSQAADRVKSGELKTDKALFDFVQPALIQLRKDKQRPFDEIFQLSLPRGEDGSFAGKEAEVESFLRRIAASW
jgi:hypothetical protein